MTGPLRGCAAAVLALATASTGAVGAAPAGASSTRATDPSTTTVTVEGTAAPQVSAVYGQTLTAAAQVSVPGAAADGWVFFVVDGLARRTDVAADGTASATIEGLGVGSHQVSATFVPRDPFLQDGSTSAETGVVVERAVPRPSLRVTGRRAGRVLAVRLRVRTPWATEATGRVAITLDPRGAGAKRSRRVHLEGNAVSVPLGRVQRGSYRVTVRYPGDAHTVPFRLDRDVRVRRP